MIPKFINNYWQPQDLRYYVYTLISKFIIESTVIISIVFYTCLCLFLIVGLLRGETQDIQGWNRHANMKIMYKTGRTVNLKN